MVIFVVHIQGTGCGKMMFMTSEETFGSQRSLRGVPPSEKLHSLPKYTQNQDINTQRGNAARLPELTPALYHNFINCSWSLWYSEQCTDCEESRHISWAKCARKNSFIFEYIQSYYISGVVYWVNATNRQISLLSDFQITHLVRPKYHKSDSILKWSHSF